jgi:hypothetical protein
MANDAAMVGLGVIVVVIHYPAVEKPRVSRAARGTLPTLSIEDRFPVILTVNAVLVLELFVPAGRCTLLRV